MAAVAAAQAPAPATITPAIDEAPTKAHSYDWMARHNQVVARVKQGNVGLLMVGDSITHIWGGDPGDGHGRAEDLWEKYLRPRNAVNLGFGWDRTQHVLWRFANGEIDGIQPKVAVVMIGTNNVGVDSDDDIALGIKTIVEQLRHKDPDIKILLLGIFPRDHLPNTENRKHIAAINGKIAELGSEPGVTFLDIGAKFLEPDGTISADTMPDFLHPSHKGYEIWMDAMEPALQRLYPMSGT